MSWGTERGVESPREIDPARLPLMLGSVFLGDRSPHRRLFSTSTLPPPLSPPPTWMSPALSLQLRIRWLEALLVGVRQDINKGKKADEPPEDDFEEVNTLMRQAEDVQRNLKQVVDSSEGIRKFMDQFDQHAHLLTPSFAFSQNNATTPSYSSLSSSELDAFLAEMETDIRGADRDLRDIETLEKKGVTAAGRLEEHEAFQPRINALLRAHKEDMSLYRSLEKRIGDLLEKYTSHVDTLSELFVAWNDVITEAEDAVSRLEREREAERKTTFV